MASRQMVQSMITCFCDLYNKRMDESLVNSWVQALNRFTDEQISKGGAKAMEEFPRMPTPSDVISRMPNVVDEHLPYILEENRKCGLCGYSGMCIREEPYSDTWRCRQCYSGLTKEQYAVMIRDLIKIMGKEGLHDTAKPTAWYTGREDGGKQDARQAGWYLGE